MVNEKFVNKDQYTGTYGHMLMADTTLQRAPLVKIQINTHYYACVVESGCLPEALYDLLIANIEGAGEP